MLNTTIGTVVAALPTIKPGVVSTQHTSFEDITWLAGQVFLWRDFVKETDERGLRAVFTACPYGDLHCKQRATFTAAFYHPRLREVVAQWWRVYDEARSAGEIPQAGDWY